LTCTDIKRFKIVLPPPNEQLDLVSKLRQETRRLDTIIAGTEREISLLREYRTRLIADVVTGKLDVREAAARVPAEAEEPESLDEVEGDEDSDGAELDAAIEEAEA
jgi:type I restriction enzyme S subunit